MCETRNREEWMNDPLLDILEQASATQNGIELVVGAMSPKVKDELLQVLIGQTLADQGDFSTLDQWQRLQSNTQLPFHTLDHDLVRPVLAASATVHALIMGAENDDNSIIALAQAVVEKTSFTTSIC